MEFPYRVRLTNAAGAVIFEDEYAARDQAHFSAANRSRHREAAAATVSVTVPGVSGEYEQHERVTVYTDGRPECPHGCGMCDAPMRFDFRTMDGHPQYVCTACGCTHTSQDCCA